MEKNSNVGEVNLIRSSSRYCDPVKELGFGNLLVGWCLREGLCASPPPTILQLTCYQPLSCTLEKNSNVGERTPSLTRYARTVLKIK
ncbi:MAG: hypothetical protein IT213_02875 [Cytophagales bacterium]|nr:hypothetical protein [Cytophagales bacterium]